MRSASVSPCGPLSIADYLISALQHLSEAGIEHSRLVARKFITLGLGDSLARVVAFGATIYLARTLGAAGYGVVGFATAVLLYFSYLADCGIEMLGVTDIAADPERIVSVSPAVLTARLLVAAGLSLLLIVVGLAALPQPDGMVLAVFSLTLPIVALNTRWIHLGVQSAGRVAVSRLLGESTMVAFILILVHGTGDVGAVPLAQLLGDSLAALILLWWLARAGFRLPATIDWGLALPVFRRSWPLMLNALLGLMIFNSDLVFLRVFRDPATVGYYAAAYSLISFFLNLGSAYSLSLLPVFTRLEAEPDRQHELYHTAMAHVFVVGLPIAIGGSLLALPIVRLVFGGGFGPSAQPLTMLLWSIPISALRTVPQVALIAAGRQDRVLEMTAWATGLNLILNFLLIPPYGIPGAAAATVATEIVRTVLALIYAKRQGFDPTPAARFWRSALAGAAMMAVLLLARPSTVLTGIPLGVMAYGAALAATGGIRFSSGRMPDLHV